LLNLLSLENLEVVLSGTTLVKGVSLSVKKGEIIGLVGESGSGKSVTAHSILNLFPRNSKVQLTGRIVYDGVDLIQMSEKKMCSIRGSEIAMIFQDALSALNPLMKIGKQISEPLELRSQLSKKQILSEVIELLDYVGINDPEKCYLHYPHELSGGMRQRVMIAIALASKPKLLIADEPTTALDVLIQSQIIDLLMKIKEDTGMSILLITHDLGVVAGTCDRVYVMDNGSIADHGTVDHTFYESSHPATRSLIDKIRWRCNV